MSSTGTTGRRGRRQPRPGGWTEYLLKYSSVLSVVRSVFVNVDGEEAKLVMRESRGCPISRDCDCYVLVYSVNDAKSYGK